MCFYTRDLLDALLEAGRGSTDVATRLEALAGTDPPVDAQLFVGRARSRLDGNPERLVDAIESVLRRGEERASTYTAGRLVDLLADVHPASSKRLDPYRDRLRELVRSMGQNDPAGYWIFTGDLTEVLDWSRKDLAHTMRSSLCSYALMYTLPQLGPLAAPLADDLAKLMRESDPWDRHAVCKVLAAVGPDPAARALVPEIRALAGTFRPSRRVEPALVMWAVCRDVRGALDILMPLLEDRSWGTTHAAWALGQMGADATEALPALRALAKGSNPAYARWAGKAVERIEADRRGDRDLEALWRDLGSDDHLASVRALWRLKDRGWGVVPFLNRRLRADADARNLLPGRLQRLRARVRQVMRNVK
jgi:hypothetical protein